MKNLVGQLVESGIKIIRKIRGDGNCYYRAVYFAYFELVIKTGEEALTALIRLYIALLIRVELKNRR